MVLSDEVIAALQKARERYRSEAWLEAYKLKIEELRIFHEELAKRREPTWVAMKEPCNF